MLPGEVQYAIENCINYLRRSRQDIEREKKTGEDTLGNQRRLMAKVLDDMQIPYDVAEEIGSGDKIETRPVFIQVLEWLEQGKYNAIAVKELARLGRGSYGDMEKILDLIDRKRIYIITPYRIYDYQNNADRQQIRFAMFLSREEYEMIKDRLISGKLTNAYEGRWVVGAAPFGYDLNNITTRLEPNDVAAIIRMIFDLYVYGIEQPDGTVKDVSFQAISNYLNSLGIPSPRNVPNGWRYMSVKRIIENVAYIGTLKYRTRMRKGNKYYDRPKSEWIVVENAHEPIIEREVWDLAQEKLSGRQRPRVKMDFSPCELAGLVVCKKCGRRMVRQTSTQHYKKKDGTVSVYKKEFICCMTKGCTYMKYRDVESDIIKALETLKELNVEQLKKIYEKEFARQEKEQGNGENVVDMIEKQRKELKRRLDFIRDKHIKGIYDDDEFLEEKAKIKKELDTLNEMAPDPNQKNNPQREKAVIKFKEALKYVLTYYNDSTDKTEKNKLLGLVVNKALLSKTGKGTYDLEIIPRMKKIHFEQK